MVDWGSWRSDPILIGGLIALGWAYAVAAGPGRARLAPGRPYPAASALRFYGGLALLYLAWGSPLDLVARYLLCSAHALQDLLVLFPAAILLLRGAPEWMVDPFLARLGPLPRLVLRPAVCGTAFVALVSGWYLPRIFEPSLRSDPLHALQGACFLAVGLLLWWPLIGPSRRHPPLGFGGQMLYLAAVEIAMTGLFTYILMAEHGIYPTYNHAPRLAAWLDSYEDQVLGGVLLSVVSSLYLVGALGVTFARWARTEHAHA